MDWLNPTTWPVPRIDWFFDGIRQYYSALARENPEAGPLIVWGLYFGLSWLAKKVSWVQSNKIPELIVGIFTGGWRTWTADKRAVIEKLKNGNQ